MSAPREPRLVLLFGLSANPPTGRQGHVGLVEWAATHPVVPVGGRRVAPDEVWVLPVFRHAYAVKQNMPAWEHRLRMAELAFQGLAGGRVRVSEAERELALASPLERLGTIDLVRFLEARHPELRFALLLGADTYQDLAKHRWKESDALLARLPIVVAERAGVEGVGGAQAAGLGPVSSSEARAAEPARLAELVTPEVYAYILAHGLYRAGARG